MRDYHWSPYDLCGDQALVALLLALVAVLQVWIKPSHGRQDFSISLRSLSAPDAEDYFINYWLARRVERSKLDEGDRIRFDEALVDYVYACALLHHGASNSSRK